MKFSRKFLFDRTRNLKVWVYELLCIRKLRLWQDTAEFESSTCGKPLRCSFCQTVNTKFVSETFVAYHRNKLSKSNLFARTSSQTFIKQIEYRSVDKAKYPKQIDKVFVEENKREGILIPKSFKTILIRLLSVKRFSYYKTIRSVKIEYNFRFSWNENLNFCNFPSRRTPTSTPSISSCNYLCSSQTKFLLPPSWKTNSGSESWICLLMKLLINRITK